MRDDLDIMVTQELVQDLNHTSALDQDLSRQHQAGLEELLRRYESKAAENDDLVDLIASRDAENERLKNELQILTQEISALTSQIQPNLV